MEKKPSFRETISKTFKIIKGHRSSYILIVMFCLLAALFNSLAPYFLGYATDSLYKSISEGIAFDVAYIVKVLVIVLCCYAINAVSVYFKSFLASDLGQKIGYTLRKKLVTKINKIKA